MYGTVQRFLRGISFTKLAKENPILSLNGFIFEFPEKTAIS